MSPPIDFSYVRYTSCSGCQLMLLNLESSLEDLAGLVRVNSFDLASSKCVPLGRTDLALVEGSISSTVELEHLLRLRKAAGTLVAVGLCAISGGINTLADRDRLAAPPDKETGRPEYFPPQPLHRFVRVDAEIHGCPPERCDLENLIGALLRGGRPARQEMSVCMECRTAEHRCLLIEDRQICLGPVTRAGCEARCPGAAVGCEGCRGMVAEANLKEMLRLLMESGVSEQEALRRLNRFGEGQHA